MPGRCFWFCKTVIKNIADGFDDISNAVDILLDAVKKFDSFGIIADVDTNNNYGNNNNDKKNDRAKDMGNIAIFRTYGWLFWYYRN